MARFFLVIAVVIWQDYRWHPAYYSKRVLREAQAIFLFGKISAHADGERRGAMPNRRDSTGKGRGQARL